MTTVQEQAQIGLEEVQLDNSNLAKALDDWFAAKDRLKGPAKAYRAINRTVKELIDQAHLPDGSYRCNGAVIKLSSPEGTRIEVLPQSDGYALVSLVFPATAAKGRNTLSVKVSGSASSVEQKVEIEIGG